MNKKELNSLKNISFKDIDKNKIIDINNILVNQELEKNERIRSFLETIPNPYFLRCGDIIVKMSYSQNNVFLNECIERYLIECLNDRL